MDRRRNVCSIGAIRARGFLVVSCSSRPLRRTALLVGRIGALADIDDNRLRPAGDAQPFASFALAYRPTGHHAPDGR